MYNLRIAKYACVYLYNLWLLKNGSMSNLCLISGLVVVLKKSLEDPGEGILLFVFLVATEK